MIFAQAPYADLAKETRAAVLTAMSSGKISPSSTRFALPENTAGYAASSEVFLENACRGAINTSVRPVDLKAEIARVYSRVVSRELVAKK